MSSLPDIKTPCIPQFKVRREKRSNFFKGAVNLVLCLGASEKEANAPANYVEELLASHEQPKQTVYSAADVSSKIRVCFVHFTTNNVIHTQQLLIHYYNTF